MSESKELKGKVDETSSPAAADNATQQPAADNNTEGKKPAEKSKDEADKERAAEALRKMNIAELLAGLTVGQKNQKDMSNYKFWSTQPVPRFDDKGELVQGPIKVINPDEVPKEPDPLLDGFEWTTLDLTDPKELQELYDLLKGHYVEDDNAMFRFNYSKSFLNWYVLLPVGVSPCVLSMC